MGSSFFGGGMGSSAGPDDDRRGEQERGRRDQRDESVLRYALREAGGMHGGAGLRGS